MRVSCGLLSSRVVSFVHGLLDGTKPSVFNIAIQLGTDNDQNEEKDELPREKITEANFVLFHTSQLAL